MPRPHSPEVRRFAAVAIQRFEDAEILLASNRTVGAMYLAGYAVECILKALLLAHTPARQQAALVGSFRGTRAHSFEWLKERLHRRGLVIPAGPAKQLVAVNTWTPDWRYTPGNRHRRDADDFLAAVEHFLLWGKGRL